MFLHIIVREVRSRVSLAGLAARLQQTHRGGVDDGAIGERLVQGIKSIGGTPVFAVDAYEGPWRYDSSPCRFD